MPVVDVVVALGFFGTKIMLPADVSLLCLAYLSFATDNFADDDLMVLAQQSAAKNARLGVTGMLLHGDGLFLQFLEGDGDVVRALLAKIAADKRHRDLVLVLDEQIQDRHFPDWSMGLTRSECLPSADRAAIVSLADSPPALPDSHVTATIRHLIASFQTVARQEWPAA